MKIVKFHLLNFTLIAFFSLLFTVFAVRDVQALVTYHYSNTPSEHASIIENGICDSLNQADHCPDVPSACFNNESIGVTNCGEGCRGGSAWSKYAFSGCYNGDNPGQCVAEYQYDDRVCSTGDKCMAGEQGLRAGSCTCGNYGSYTYKYCCSATGNAEACTTGGVTQDPYPPSEGQCPGGYIVDGSRVRSSSCVPLVTCTNQASYNQCGQTGGCTNNYPSNHTISITPSSCTDGSTQYQCSDLGMVSGACYTPPNLTAFTGSCQQAAYTASLNWSGTPLPSSDGGCPNGYWVDISTSSGFSSYSNKCVTGTSLTTNGSEGWMSSGNFSFSPGTNYYARVYNGSHSNTLSLAVPSTSCTAGDTQPPACNGVTVSPTHGPAGTVVNITASASDNVLVQNMQIFKNNGNNLLSSFTNTLKNNPFTKFYSWNTQGETQGSYTIIVNASDNSGNTMFGNNTNCKTSFTLDPPAPWVPPACTGSTFSGCNTQGQTRCTNWGVPQDPRCADACSRSNPNTFCALPSCQLSASPPQSNNSTLTTSLSVTVNTSNMAGSKVSYWSFGDGTNQFNSSLTSTHTYTSTSPKTYNPTFKAVDGVSGADLSQSCTTSVTLSPNSSCSLTASPNQDNKPVTSTLTATVNNLSTMPGSKLSQWDLDGNGSFETQDASLSHSVTTSSTKTYQFRVVDGAKNTNQNGYILSGPCSAPVTISTTAAGNPPPASGGSCNSPFSCMSGLGGNCYESSQKASNYCKSLGYNYCGLCQSTSLYSNAVRIKVVETTNPLPPTPWPQCSYPTTLNGCLDKNNTCVANYFTSTPGQCYIPIISESGSPVNCPGEESGYNYCGTNPSPNSACVFTKPWTYTSTDSETGETFTYTQPACFLRTYGDITTCSNANYSMNCFGTDIPNPPTKGVPGVKVQASCITHLGKLGDEGAGRFGTTGADGDVTIDVPYTYIMGSGGYNNVDCIAKLADNPDNPLKLVYGTSRYWNNIVPVHHYDTGKTDPGGRIPIIASTISQIFLQTSGPNANSYLIQGDGPNYLFVVQTPILPWIQTTGGDVHSNTRINTPGGP